MRWKTSAAREIRKLPKDAVQRILAVVQELSVDPFPPGTRKLLTTEHTYRVRSGDYRIVYRILNEVLVIEIVRVGHRRNVYRRR
jgi:mRNA interferase RelE/StbE